jgi:AraC family transcriptional activator of pyochelin receptor
MAARQIYEHNIPELEHCYGNPPKDFGNGCLTPFMSTRHPELGSFHVSNLAFPNLHLLDMQWNIPEEIVIHESNPSATVDINFVLEGNVKGVFRGLDAEFTMTKGTNNLKYTPSEKSSHAALRQDAKMFVVSLDKTYFCSLIGSDSHWSEMTQRKMERSEDFLASEKFLTTTPQMQMLIHAIRNTQPGPTSRLLTQSMVFELIAHQLEQLTSRYREVKPTKEINLNDIEKLHAVKQYIDEHFLDDLTLTGLSREGMLNEFKLKKGFKALFGTSVIHYVRQLRMQHARTLLRDHRMTVEEVSSRVGYQYPNHFAVAFKKHFGILPSDR